MRRLFRNRPSGPRGGFTHRLRAPHSRTREVREDLNKLMADVDPTDPNYPIEEKDSHRHHHWSPRADVIEREGEYVIRLEIPGVSKNDTYLEQYSDILHVYGVRRERYTDEHRIARQESLSGPFSRRIPLPADIDRDAITASSEQGVLTIRLPKKQTKSATRAVEVN